MNITDKAGHMLASQPDELDRGDGKKPATSQERPGSRSGGFKNDPDDLNNPNEAIEREREAVEELEDSKSQRDRTSNKT